MLWSGFKGEWTDRLRMRMQNGNRCTPINTQHIFLYIPTSDFVRGRWWGDIFNKVEKIYSSVVSVAMCKGSEQMHDARKPRCITSQNEQMAFWKLGYKMYVPSLSG